MSAGASPQTGGAYSAPPDPLAGLRGPTSKGRGREGDGTGKGREEGGEGKGRGGEGPTSRGREGALLLRAGGKGRGEGRGMGTTSFWTLPPPLLSSEYVLQLTCSLFFTYLSLVTRLHFIVG